MFPAKSPIYRAFLLPKCRDFRLHIRRCKTVVFALRMDLNSCTTKYLHRRQTSHLKLVCRFLLPTAQSFAKDFGLSSFHDIGYNIVNQRLVVNNETSPMVLTAFANAEDDINDLIKAAIIHFYIRILTGTAELHGSFIYGF